MSIGVSPVSRNDGCTSANGCAAKFALQAFDHRPVRESGTQAGRLCYLGLGYVPDALASHRSAPRRDAAKASSRPLPLFRLLLILLIAMENFKC